jgi:[ribosomal protein S18]-alanine N-acetyltransferase
MSPQSQRAYTDTLMRPMTVADLDRVIVVETQAYSFPWSRGHFTDSLAAGYLAQLLVQPTPPGGRRAAAEPVLIGYYVAMQGVDELHLLNLTIAPPFQGQGHGRALLAHLVDAGRALNAQQLWLEVRESNARARQLYERWGFSSVGLRQGYYPAAHGQREHAVVMRWPLGDVPCHPGGADELD